jgi:APA family basic amino acid/polyamine antiporter
VKPIEEPSSRTTGTPASTDGLRRVIGPVSATSIVIGAIIGVGIFFTPTSVARIAGSANLAMWIWAAGGLVALLGALTFAELGGMYGHTAGQYEMLRDSYGPLIAFCFSLCNACAIIAGGTAIIAIVCAENLSTALTGAPLSGVTAVVLPAVLLVSVAGANILGVRWGTAIQNVTVLAKVGTLLLVAVIAMVAAPHAAPAVPAAPSTAPLAIAFFSGLVPALFSYGGGHYALWVAGEMKNPRRDVPLSLVAGVSIVVVVYLLANWAYLRLLGYDGVAGSHALAADAVSVAWPSAGRRIIALAVALSAFGVLNVQILSGPRLLYGMARDGRFFSIFGKPHPRFATPAAALALVGGIAATLVIIAGKNAIDRLLTGVVMVDAVFFALTGFAVIVLRRRRRDADRPVRVPLYPVVPIVFVLFQLGIIAGAFQMEATRAAAWIGLCAIVVAVILYATRFRHAARSAQ